MGVLKASLGPVERVLGASWASLGPSWRLLGDLGATCGGSWAVSGRRKAEKKDMSKSVKNLRKIYVVGLFWSSWRPSWGPLGPFWGAPEPSWEPSWASWRPLGPCGGPSWGRRGGLFGSFGSVPDASSAVLLSSWAVSGRRKAEKKHMPQSFNNLWTFYVFGLFWPSSWRPSWRPLGPSWAVLGPGSGGLVGSWSV